jgi:hypothetical protein
MLSQLIMEAIEAAVERRRPPRFLAAVSMLVGLGASGCATKKAVTFDDFRSSGQAIEVSEGGSFSEQRRYILADEQFIVEIREPHDMGAGVYRFDLARFDRRTLGPGVAAEAWRQIYRLRVESWRKSYSAPDGADGRDWAVDMRVGDASRRSSGNSAYPELANPDGTVVDARESSFQALTAILEPLGR